LWCLWRWCSCWLVKGYTQSLAQTRGRGMGMGGSAAEGGAQGKDRMKREEIRYVFRSISPSIHSFFASFAPPLLLLLLLPPPPPLQTPFHHSPPSFLPPPLHLRREKWCPAARSCPYGSRGRFPSTRAKVPPSPCSRWMHLLASNMGKVWSRLIVAVVVYRCRYHYAQSSSPLAVVGIAQLSSAYACM
jgi:hypothetical protein